VINDQLTFSAEQIGQGLFAGRRIEHIIFVHPFPRQLAALLAQGVARPGKSLFLGEVGLARRDPFIAADDSMRFHLRLHVLLHAAYSAGVIQPTPAPPGSSSMAMRPTPGTSNGGFITVAPALTAFFRR
jgi:hypothetical protein